MSKKSKKKQKYYQGMQYSPYYHPHAMWPHCPHPMHGHPYYPPHPGMPPQGNPDAGEPMQGYHYHHPHHHHHHHEAHDPGYDAMYQQAQEMVDGMMGEQAGMFKEIMHKIGVDDKEFWKGAIIGAAAALILGNENVRNSMLQILTGAGDMLKTGGEKVKETATSTAQSVKESATTGSEIFQDTYSATKQGFKDSVARHRETKKPESEQGEKPSDEPSDE